MVVSHSLTVTGTVLPLAKRHQRIASSVPVTVQRKRCPRSLPADVDPVAGVTVAVPAPKTRAAVIAPVATPTTAGTVRLPDMVPPTSGT